MLLSGVIEQLADDAIVQVDDFVSDRSRALDGERHQSGITAPRLELGQIRGCHLTAFASDLEQSVLVNPLLDAGRQVERLPHFETLDVLQHVPRVRLDG